MPNVADQADMFVSGLSHIKFIKSHIGSNDQLTAMQMASTYIPQNKALAMAIAMWNRQACTCSNRPKQQLPYFFVNSALSWGTSHDTKGWTDQQYADNYQWRVMFN